MIRCPADGGLGTFDEAAQRIGGVDEGRPAVCDLHRRRHADVGGLDMEPEAVAADDADAWMSGEPVPQRSGEESGSRSMTRRRSRAQMTVP